MKELTDKLFADKTILWGTVLSLIILFFSLVLVALFYRVLPPILPAFNQLPWGTDRLAGRPALLIPIGIAFTIVVGNSIVINIVYERMQVAARMLTLTTLLVSTLTLIFIFRIIQLVL